MRKKNLLLFPLAFSTIFGLAACDENDTQTNSSAPNDTTDDNKPTTPTTPVADPVIQSFRIDYSKVDTNLVIGEELDTSQLRVYARLKDEEEKQLTASDYTLDLSSFNNLAVGTYYIKVIYRVEDEVKQRSFAVNVTSILDNVDYVIGITAEGAKESYKFAESLDTKDLVVTAYYKSERTEILTEDQYEIDSSAFDSKMRGNYEIKVKYYENYTSGSHTEKVEVETCFFAKVELTMDKITVSGNSTFYQYEDLDISDWVVTVHYQEGVTEKIKKGFITDADEKLGDLKTPKTAIVSVSYTYNGKTATTNKTCQVKAITYDLNAGKLETCDKQLTENVIDSNFTLMPGYSVLADSAICGSQSFNKSIFLDGNGTRDENSIKINTTKAAKIFVCVSSDEGARFGIYDENGNGIRTSSIGSNIIRLEIDVYAGGIYYLWTDSAVNVFYIGICE